ncbi:unnamed protein product [Clavelina lepadiformis]|uniref:Major facilitator superfamily (MFS) profile domain-containing protein n=1 Tax=Clavelina lepadiformis TaxID=159417 RepID=A0ABP0FU84_CLALP
MTNQETFPRVVPFPPNSHRLDQESQEEPTFPPLRSHANDCLHIYPDVKIVKPKVDENNSASQDEISAKHQHSAYNSISDSFANCMQPQTSNQVFTPTQSFVSSFERMENQHEIVSKLKVYEGTASAAASVQHTSTPNIVAYSAPELPHEETANESYNDRPSSLVRINKSLRRFSRRQWNALLGVCYVNFSSNASFSVLSSFFAEEAKLHGASDWEVGLIFGSYAVINAICCPLFGYILPRIGSKTMLLVGMIFSAFCSFIFSQLFRIQSTSWYVAASFICRGCQAFGCAAYFTGSAVVIAQEWTENMTFAMGLSEVFTGLGMICGPLLGGWLYQTGGFQLPFIVVGIIMCIGFVINSIVVPRRSRTVENNGNFLKLIRIPSVAANALFMSAMWAAMDFNMPILSLHMKSLNASPVVVGTMFLIMAASYTIVAPFVGIYAKTRVAEKVSMIAGGFVVCFSFLLIGPSIIFSFLKTFQKSVTTIVISMILLGLGLSVALIPTFNDLSSSALKGGMKNDLATAGLVGGLFNGATFFGEFVGAAAGGAMLDYFKDFSIVTTVFSGCLFAIVIAVLIFYLVYWRKVRSEAQQEESDLSTTQTLSQPKASDSTPLLH